MRRCDGARPLVRFRFDRRVPVLDERGRSCSTRSWKVKDHRRRPGMMATLLILAAALFGRRGDPGTSRRQGTPARQVHPGGQRSGRSGPAGPHQDEGRSLCRGGVAQAEGRWAVPGPDHVSWASGWPGHGATGRLVARGTGGPVWERSCGRVMSSSSPTTGASSSATSASRSRPARRATSTTGLPYSTTSRPCRMSTSRASTSMA